MLPIDFRKGLAGFVHDFHEERVPVFTFRHLLHSIQCRLNDVWDDWERNLNAMIDEVILKTLLDSRLDITIIEALLFAHAPVFADRLDIARHLVVKLREAMGRVARSKGSALYLREL